jgi:3-hydroxyacyl-CoA dehydrogenase/enoyl-CoA hydratase/3-hydroxybutyryl-CoA epimerase
VPAALQAILTGRLYTVAQAKRLGMVDRSTPPEYLSRVAAKIAMGSETPRRRGRTMSRLLVDRNPLARAFIARQARKQVFGKTRGHYPAPLAAIDVVCGAPAVAPARQAEVEARAVARLAVGPVCKSLIGLFFASEEAKKLGRGEGVREVRRVGVIGAGVMGGAIASLCANKGMSARLADLAPAALDAAQHAHRAEIAKQRKKRRLPPHEAAAAIDRFEVTEQLVGFQRADLVVEAVAERLDVKRKVLGELAAQMRPDAILATNTSSLSVDAIATGIPNPERVCGMHFFNPVRKMPLVEVVRGPRTDDSVVATTCALAVRLGKTPVVVRDVAGFLVNRILGPYLDEAVRMFDAGADVGHVDRLLVRFGMPMGPFRLLDEVGFDIARHAADSLFEAYGERMAPSDALARLSSEQRLGRKTGLGFYRHPRGGKPEVAGDLGSFRSGSKTYGDDEIVDRLVLTMVNEAARCLEEEVVTGPRELDLATVMGTGFAPFRGGVWSYALGRGLRDVADRLEALAADAPIPVRLAPAALLRENGESRRMLTGAGV